MKTPFLNQLINNIENHIKYIESTWDNAVPQPIAELSELKAIKKIIKRFDGAVQVKLAWHEELDIPILRSIDEPYNEVEADTIYAIPESEYK